MVVRLMQLPPVPLPLQETLLKLAFRATPFARIAGAVCAITPVALTAFELFVTLTVPPPARLIPVPFEVVTASDSKVSVAPVFVPDHWTPLPPVPVLFTVAPPAKLIRLPLAAFWMTMVSGTPVDKVAAPF